jgi:hypothetical protein
MKTQLLKERIVDILNAEITEIESYDAEQFGFVELPNISVKMQSCDRMTKAMTKAFTSQVEITLRAHSGDSLSVDQINGVTNEIEALLSDNFKDQINAGINNLCVDYFAHNGGIPEWEDNTLQCRFDCEVIFQII